MSGYDEFGEPDGASVLADAIGSLSEWLPGYSTPEGRPQDRVTLLHVGADSITVLYERTTGSEAGAYPPKPFRIQLRVLAGEP